MAVTSDRVKKRQQYQYLKLILHEVYEMNSKSVKGSEKTSLKSSHASSNTKTNGETKLKVSTTIKSGMDRGYDVTGTNGIKTVLGL